jgi:antitoxin VapB
MALSLKNPETERLAKKLAKLTGESVTMAVTVALQERLDRQRTNPKEGLAEWLLKLGEQTAPLMNDGKTSVELIEGLYDPKTGLSL